MLKLTKGKKAYMDNLSADDGFIKALAIDQRGAMGRMFDDLNVEVTHEEIEELKRLVSEELTPYASSILLDPVYGMPATNTLLKDAG